MPLSKRAALAKDRASASRPCMEHRHFAVIAAIIDSYKGEEQRLVALHFADELEAANPRFDRRRFLTACGA